MFKDQSVLRGDDTMMDALMKMSEGNPGAMSVLADIIKTGHLIDPDDFAGGFGTILTMDTHAIRGPKVWMLFKDVCHQDLVKTIAMARATQLGILPVEKLLHAIDNRGAGIDVDALLGEVRKRLPNFGKEETISAVDSCPEAETIASAESENITSEVSCPEAETVATADSCLESVASQG